jgi:hypothetical protein
MMRKVYSLLGMLFLFAVSAHAQGYSDKVEVFGGYAYLHLDPTSTSLNGWEGSAQYKFTDWLGGVADFSGDYGSIGGVGTSLHCFLFGPQVSFPAKLSPFAHVLIGGAHSSIGGVGDNAFAAAIGAGFDYKVEHGLSWRIFQADYLATRFGSNTQNNVRVSTGIVFRF